MAGSIHIDDRTEQAGKKIYTFTDDRLGRCMEDAAKLVQQMTRDKLKKYSTGRLASSVQAFHKSTGSKILHGVKEEALDPGQDGNQGYSAKIEWGYTHTGGKKMRGKGIVKRGTFGMIRRYMQGGAWDENRK